MGIRRGGPGFTTADEAEAAAAKLDWALEVTQVEEAIEMRAIYSPPTPSAIHAPNLRLFQEALAPPAGPATPPGVRPLVDEIPGLFFPPKSQPYRDAKSRC